MKICLAPSYRVGSNHVQICLNGYVGDREGQWRIITSVDDVMRRARRYNPAIDRIDLVADCPDSYCDPDMLPKHWRAVQDTLRSLGWPL